jgi:outer membrane protein
MKVARELSASLVMWMLLACAGSATAQEGHTRWGLGIGAIAQDLGYKGQGSDSRLVPVIYVESGRFFLMGPRAGWRLLDGDSLSVTAIANYRFDGYESDDSRALEGMNDRDGSLDAGLEAQYRADFGELTVSAVTDTLENHSGEEVALRYGYPLRVGRGRVTPFLEASWLSEDLVDYYYGVRGDEALAERPVYRPGSTTNVTLGVSGSWLFSRRHLVFLNGGYQWLGSEIENSPIIDSDTGASVILGWVYTF